MFDLSQNKVVADPIEFGSYEEALDAATAAYGPGTVDPEGASSYAPNVWFKDGETTVTVVWGSGSGYLYRSKAPY
jgi:hypothetical protein